MLRIFIGWDSRFPEPAQVLAHSLRRYDLHHSLDIRYLDKQHLERCYGLILPEDPRASTEFTYSRFLVPYLCHYQGVALFLDNDILCCEPFTSLEEMAEEGMAGLALRVVQHDHQPTESTKMHGVAQSSYPRKNWSSVMLMDCSRLMSWHPEVIAQGDGARLHRFQDIPDFRIGPLPPRYNVLSDHYVPFQTPCSFLHYTSGGPWNTRAKTWPHEELWLEERRRWQEARAKGHPV